MTIKTDPVVCLILPRNLVGIQGPVEDIVLVWGWLVVRNKARQASTSRIVFLYGHMGMSPRNPVAVYPQALKGQEFLFSLSLGLTLCALVQLVHCPH